MLSNVRKEKPTIKNDSESKFSVVELRLLHFQPLAALPQYRVFQKELHNFESLYKFIQKEYTVF
jgi:hypothetical protein